MIKNIHYLFTLGIIISFAVGYTLGNNQKTLTKSEFDCLIEKNVDENVTVSKNQAMCLVGSGEVVSFYGLGNPFYSPDEFLRLKLKSSKTIFVKDELNNILIIDASSEFQDELEAMGVYRISK